MVMKVNKIISWLYTEGIDFKMSYESPQYTIKLVAILKSITIMNQPPENDDDGEILQLVLDGESILLTSNVDLFLNTLQLIINLSEDNTDKKLNFEFKSVREIIQYYMKKIINSSFNLNINNIHNTELNEEYEKRFEQIKQDLGSLIQDTIDDPDNIF
jgi:hypothetical protein